MNVSRTAGAVDGTSKFPPTCPTDFGSNALASMPRLALSDAKSLYLRCRSRVSHAARIAGGRSRGGGLATGSCLREDSSATRCSFRRGA